MITRRTRMLRNGGRRRSAVGSGWALAAAMLLAALTGCAKTETRFEIVSFLEAGAPERFSEAFPPGAFAQDGLDNHQFVFELDPIQVEVPARSTTKEVDAKENAAPELETLWMSQLIHVQVVWRPLPGKTFAERTQTNATICYCLLIGDSAISYEGAGFVYFEPSRDGNTAEGRIESSTLYPARIHNTPIDLFGPCRLTGDFEAKLDKRAVFTAQRRLRGILGGPILPQSPQAPTPAP